MDAHIRKVYVPMTETGFYILLCLVSSSTATVSCRRSNV